MRNRILILDDEPAIARVLQPVLEATGSTVLTAANAQAGLHVARTAAINVVLLDLGLPDADGKELISTLRSFGDMAIIVISARHQGSEKVAALDAGADDYVDKPFDIAELMARIRVAQRRASSHGREREQITVGELSVHFGRREVRLMGDEVKLSPKEFDLLRTLLEHAGQVVTHRRLLLAGWGDPAADPQYLRSYIALLRQKLEEDAAEPRILLTEPGVGYRLAG
ncbi:response regulator [Allosphingosinicella deserti]|uniref:DNA-binding response regulator n=1 Tax=Allosphingosinicella deserti TaxID=2116704 RepID=A0A2P7QDX2_9SPHN|nr:response regulator [Sphingomonas deserti]PSJ36169.1 DNA-binding response regulator [Sphingomonas deserti]